LACHVPVRSINPFTDISRIGHLCELIISDFQSLRHVRVLPVPGYLA
jgi:hypothetical protein